jgi:acyl carrier protein
MEDKTYRAVLAIVRRVLRADAVDVHEDFFDLGASSLAIVQIVDLVRHECGAEVSVTDAFDAPDLDTFARLAAERSPQVA